MRESSPARDGGRSSSTSASRPVTSSTSSAIATQSRSSTSRRPCRRCNSPSRSPDIVELQGVDAIVDHASAIIRSAESEIYLSVWGEEVSSRSSQELEDADARGVRIAGMLYGVDPPEVGWWQRHSYRETVASRIGGRMLTVVGRRGRGADRPHPGLTRSIGRADSEPRPDARRRGVPDPRAHPAADEGR